VRVEGLSSTLFVNSTLTRRFAPPSPRGRGIHFYFARPLNPWAIMGTLYIDLA